MKKNLLASFLSRGLSVLISLLVTPLYVHFLGIESYGLIGFMVFLQGLLSAFDLGFGGTVNRQMAIFSTHQKTQEMRNLLRTGEVIYWCFALCIAIGLYFLANILVQSWLQSSTIRPDVLTNLIILIGINLAFHWPSFLYGSALMGLQKQVLYNTMLIGVNTLRSVGAIGILMVWPTMQAFLLWQILVSILYSCLSGILLWKSLPSTHTAPQFDGKMLRALKNSLIGFSGVTFLGLMLSVSDKLVLSKVATLREYGFYSFAFVIAGGIYSLVFPITHVYFPRFSQLKSLEDMDKLAKSYHQSSQLVSVLVFSVSLFFIFFSSDLLWHWTHNEELIENSREIVVLLMIGTAFNGLIVLPSMLQFSFGRTKLTFWMLLSLIAAMVPALCIAYPLWGLKGAAASYAALHGAYFFLYILLMHRKILPAESKSWWTKDLLAPFGAALVIPLIGKALLHEKAMLWQLILLGGATLIAAALSTSYTREALQMVFQRSKREGLS